MAEKSGIEMLEELLSKVDLLEKKISILDLNIKTLMNRERSVVKTDMHPDKKDRPKIEAVDFSKGINVKGKMTVNLDGKNVPLADISVKVFDKNDKLVKETKTNRGGQWMCLLQPGKYVALFEGLFNGKKLIPQNRNFVVPEKLKDGKPFLEIL